jgi:hypothetical protein
MRVLDGVTHLDHGLQPALVEFVLAALADKTARTKVGELGGGFCIAEVDLPEELGTVPCALHGPITGSAPVLEAECFRAKRGDRPNESRMVRRPPTSSAVVTVIMGVSREHPHAGTVIFTVYGGPLAPQEPGDPFLDAEDRPAAEAFWADHALSAEAFGL